MKCEELMSLMISYDRDHNLINGPNWQHLNIATQNKILHRYIGKKYRLEKFYIDLGDYLVNLFAEIYDAVIRLFNEIGTTLKSMGIALEELV